MTVAVPTSAFSCSSARYWWRGDISTHCWWKCSTCILELCTVQLYFIHLNFYVLFQQAASSALLLLLITLDIYFWILDMILFLLQCVCTPGWTGEFCQYVDDACMMKPNSCLNGATCLTTSQPSSPPQSTCKCPNGFTGEITLHCDSSRQYTVSAHTLWKVFFLWFTDSVIQYKHHAFTMCMVCNALQ